MSETRPPVFEPRRPVEDLFSAFSADPAPAVTEGGEALEIRSHLAVFRCRAIDRSELMKARSGEGRFSRPNQRPPYGPHIGVFVDEAGQRLLGLGIVASNRKSQGADRPVVITEYEPCDIAIGKSMDATGLLAAAASANGPSGAAREILGLLIAAKPDLASRVLALDLVINRPRGSSPEELRLRDERDAAVLLTRCAKVDTLPVTKWQDVEPGAPYLSGLAADDLEIEQVDIERRRLEWLRAARLPGDTSWRHLSAKQSTGLKLLLGSPPVVLEEQGEQLQPTSMIYYHVASETLVELLYVHVLEERDHLTIVDRAGLMAASELCECVDFSEPVVPDDPQLVRTFGLAKLCEPVAFDPAAKTLLPGAILPSASLDPYARVALTDRTRSEQPAVALDLRSLRRHLSNAQFTDLVHNGWIGCRNTPPSFVAATINDRVLFGSSVVIGIDLSPRFPGNRQANHPRPWLDTADQRSWRDRDRPEDDSSAVAE